MLSVCLRMYPRAVLGYKFLNLATYQPDILYTCEQGCEHPCLSSKSIGLRKQETFGKQWDGHKLHRILCNPKVLYIVQNRTPLGLILIINEVYIISPTLSNLVFSTTDDSAQTTGLFINLVEIIYLVRNPCR